LLFLNKEAQNFAQTSTEEREERSIWKLCLICSVIGIATRCEQSLIEKFITWQHDVLRGIFCFA